MSPIMPGPMPNALENQLANHQFETTADEIQSTFRTRLNLSRIRTEAIATQDLSSVSFESTLAALDDLYFEESEDLSRIYLLKNVHPDRALREKAKEVLEEMQTWQIERSFDERLFRVVEAYANKKEMLVGEDKKLLDDSLREYRRKGFFLNKDRRTKAQELQKRLSQLESDFSTNIREHRDELWVDESALKGLEANFVESLEKGSSGCRKLTLDYPIYLPVMEFCESEEVRRQLLSKHHQVAAQTNAPILEEIVSLRDQVAKELGYDSWNHYVIEERMAKTPERVFEFLQDLRSRLEPRAREELRELLELKREHLKDPRAEIKVWDVSFYGSRLKKNKFQIDTQSLKEYFPLPQVLDGMFNIFQRLFGIRMVKQTISDRGQWHEEVELYEVHDENKNVLGSFFLDLHPREGKYNHAAAFGLASGKWLGGSRHRRPTSVMVCNFPRSEGNRPALIPHNQVETLFHEFGHILHGVLSRTKFSSFSGTSVAHDFVEAPSQVLENWVWEHESLKTFAKHYKTGEVISENLVARLQEAKKAGIATHYLRQLSFAIADMRLHDRGPKSNVVELVGKTLSEIFLPVPEGSQFACGFGHLMGYASGYYGYAWADVMAADLFSLFKTKNIFDRELGARLRKEIYETGGSREESISLESFLKRPLSPAAFLEELGAA